jgi:magnesium transporter
MTDKTDQDSLEHSIETIKLALVEGRIQTASALLSALHPADQAEVFDELSEEQKAILLPTLDLPTAADLLEELEDEDVLTILEGLSAERLADVLDEMEPDAAADVLGDLPSQQASEVLAQMEDAAEVLPLLGYPDETAGGLMTTWYIAVRPQNTVSQAVDFLRTVSPDTRVPYYIYVLDRNKKLIGVVGFRDLVIADSNTRIEEIYKSEIIFVTADTDQEEAARVMSRYSLSALPVVDTQQRMVGVITHDDIVDVLEDEATEDIYRLANVSDSDLEPDSPIFAQIKGRLPWMYLNTITALFASWVVTHFESLIANVAILAAFQSIVAGLGGNSGSQNIALMVRALALGKSDTRTTLRALFHQITVGLLQGLAVGLVVGIGIGVWRDNFHLGLILGLAMVGNMFIAAIVGTLVPFGLKALGQDPAIASTVLVTAVTDSFGFFLFLSLATLFLPYLD